MWTERPRRWTSAASLIALAAIVSFGSIACGDDDAPALSAEMAARSSTIQSLAGNSSDGQALFAAECARCHGSDGKGGNPGPNLTGMSEATVINFALAGRGDEMPSFSSLADQDLADIAAYVVAIQ